MSTASFAVGHLEAALERRPARGSATPGSGAAGTSSTARAAIPRSASTSRARSTRPAPDAATTTRQPSAQQFADVRGRAVDVALEATAPRCPATRIAPSSSATSSRPSAAASAAPESNALSVHHALPSRSPAASRSAGSVTKSPAPRSIGRLGTGRRRAPRGLEELAVRLAEGDGARCDALGVDERDRRALRQVVDERHDAVDERGSERLHALDGDALGHLLEHAREARELVASSRGARCAHRLGEQQLAARRQRRRAATSPGSDRWSATENARICSTSSPKNSTRNGMVGDGREDVEDAAAHRELAAARDHVDARVGEVDEPGRDAAARSWPAPADDELDRARRRRGRRRAAAARRAPTRSRRAGVAPVPARDAPQHVEPAPDGLGARAQPLVRQGLPRREVEDLGVRAGALRERRRATPRGDRWA